MSWSVSWADSLGTDIRDVGYRVAESVCMAIHAFADDGVGELIFIAARGEEPSRWILRGDGGYAIVRADHAEKTLHVSRILSDGPISRVKPLLDEAPEPPPSSRG